MKIVKATVILVIGPLLGILVAFVLGALTLPADASFAATGHTAPGDGIPIIFYAVISLVASVPISMAAALWVLFGKPKSGNQVETP
jgi:hypothetical protein